MQEQSGIAAAIDAAGTQQKLARTVGVTQQLVAIWKKQGFVPVRWIVPVEQATGVHRTRLINPRIKELLEPTSL